MFDVNIRKIKNYINCSGIKQKSIAGKAGISESKLSLPLAGKRKFEVGEYAGICATLGVPMDYFLEPHYPGNRGDTDEN